MLLRIGSEHICLRNMECNKATQILSLKVSLILSLIFYTWLKYNENWLFKMVSKTVDGGSSPSSPAKEEIAKNVGFKPILGFFFTLFYPF